MAFQGWMKIFVVFGGLGLFLLGMKYMSEGLQSIAGDRLRRLISAVTSNRFFALGVGAFVTCLIQSSSVTSVMVVGFVNSGFMTLVQAIGVILGAHIGTTITGWVLVLPIAKWGLPTLGFAAIVYLFARSDRWRYWGMAFMGIGMIFFGLELMKSGFSDMPEFEQWLQTLSASSYWGVTKAVLGACLVTMIIQSSSATLGIVIGLASAGMINFETAAAMVIGLNIGTTITAFLASLGSTTNAKRAAYAHILVKVFGFLWVFPLFFVFVPWVKWGLTAAGYSPDPVAGAKVSAHIIAAIATLHTVFNVINTIIVLPLIGQYARLLTRLFPDRPSKEQAHLTNLDVRLLETPALSVEQSRVEVLRMGDIVDETLTFVRTLMEGEELDDKLAKRIIRREDVLDRIQVEIVDFLSKLLSSTMPATVTRESRRQLLMAAEYETVGDCFKHIVQCQQRIARDEMGPLTETLEHFAALHDAVAAYAKLVTAAYEERSPELMEQAVPRGDEVTEIADALRDKQMERLSGENAHPGLSMVYTDILNDYVWIRDHMSTIARSAMPSF